MINFKFQISNLRWVGWAVPTLLLFTMLCGCTKKSEPHPPQTESQSLRIIPMAPNLTEILFALGLDEEIVGVTKYSTYPEEAKTKTNVGSFWQPDIEAVLMCRPTLVITLGFSQQTALAERLKQIGCKTLTVNIETIDELYAAIGTIGSEVDRSEQAARLIERLRQQQEALSSQHAGRSDRPKVLWVVQREPLCVAGTDTFANELITISGGVNAIGATMSPYPRISTEEVLRSAPDIIIEPTMDPEQADTQRATADDFYKRYSSIPAVKNGRIYVVDGDLVSRLGPRLDKALMTVSKCLQEQ